RPTAATLFPYTTLFRSIGHLLEDGAHVVGTDVSEPAVSWVQETYPQVDLVADEAALIRSDIDVYAPCALGGALDDDSVAVLRARSEEHTSELQSLAYLV